MTKFAEMDSKDLIAYLDDFKSDVAVFQKGHHGPKEALYSVPLSKLPPLTAHVVREINYSRGKVIDFSLADWARCEIVLRKLIADDPKLPSGVKLVKSQPTTDVKERTTFHMHRGLMKERGVEVAEDLTKYSLNPDTPGSMRSYHQNDKKFLPPGGCDPSTLKDKAKLYHTYVEHFKGLQNKQIQKGVKQVFTGYIEYTCGGWRTGSNSGRIVYDYVRDHFFLTPDHYGTWYVIDLGT